MHGACFTVLRRKPGHSRRRRLSSYGEFIRVANIACLVLHLQVFQICERTDREVIEQSHLLISPGKGLRDVGAKKRNCSAGNGYKQPHSPGSMRGLNHCLGFRWIFLIEMLENGIMLRCEHLHPAWIDKNIGNHRRSVVRNDDQIRDRNSPNKHIKDAME
jgi:hypothetical protein